MLIRTFPTDLPPTFQTPSPLPDFSAHISSCSLAWVVAEQSGGVVSPQVTFPRPQEQHAAAAALLRSQLSVPGPHARPALHIFLPISFLPVGIYAPSAETLALALGRCEVCRCQAH